MSFNRQHDFVFSISLDPHYRETPSYNVTIRRHYVPSLRERETRIQYVARLRKVAKSLPRKFIDDSVADIGRRCQRLWDAKGGHFQEGGR